MGRPGAGLALLNADQPKAAQVGLTYLTLHTNTCQPPRFAGDLTLLEPVLDGKQVNVLMCCGYIRSLNGQRCHCFLDGSVVPFLGRGCNLPCMPKQHAFINGRVYSDLPQLAAVCSTCPSSAVGRK